MLLRTLTKTPKYYLVYFFVDKTMSVILHEKLINKNEIIPMKWDNVKVKLTGSTFKVLR